MHQLIIENQRNPLIFERFCAELISKSENISLVTTSFNYDRGVDVRSVQPTRGRQPFVLCVTLARELDPKVSSDIIKLFKRSTPETVYYCSSVRLTEDTCIQLEALIRNIVNKQVSVRVLGSIQLADISENYPAILEKNYRSEIENIRTIFDSREARLADKDARGLRMALMAYGSEDAQQLRENMSLQMVLDAVALGENTEDAVAARITKDFSLPKGLNSTYVVQIMKSAALKGLAVKSCQGWELTDSGRGKVETVPSEAAVNLLEGRSVIRECLETLIGQSISDSQYEKVWMTLLDGFSELFHSNGIGIVSAVSSFLNQSDQNHTEDRDLPRLIAQISARLKAIFTSDELGTLVVKAMKDMFTERDGKAFHWIAGVCERFVTMCSLGLEATSSDEIKALITRSYLVLDTDMALTLLSESEPDHNSVKELVSNWKRMGGHFLLSIPVLEEVAYHAWISDADFSGSRFLLGKLSGVDLRRYSDNTFVRAFHAISKSRSEEKYWPDYISLFKGITPHDYSNISRNLSQLLGAEVLRDSADAAFESEITKQVLEIRNQPKVERAKRQERSDDYKEKEFIDKAKRDGRLLASIASARENEARLGTDKTVVLISSSQKLRRVALKNRKRLGQPDPVLSFGALSYLISLVPNVRLGPDTLRRALFEFGESAKLQDHQQLALRVIKGSGLYQMGWATRGHLTSKLNRVLFEEASKRDVPVSQFKRDFAAGDPKTDPTAIIAASLERLSVPSELQGEVEELKRQLRDAQLEIEFLREPTRSSLRKQTKASEVAATESTKP